MLSSTVVYEFLNSGCVLTSEVDELWIGWGEATRSACSSIRGLSVYAPDFFLKDEKPWWIFLQHSKIKRAELIEILQIFLKNANSEPALPKLPTLDDDKIHWSDPDYLLFQTAFYDLKNRFQSGTLKKAVPVVFERACFEIHVEKKAALLLGLLLNTLQLPVYIYGLWNLKEGILGATPEILFQKGTDRVVYTAALAGTRLKGSTRAPILEDPKELEEHRIVIEGICSSLSSFGTVTLGETQELVLPSFSHLLTPIRLQINPSTSVSELGRFFESVVRELHPTPALGAFPREQGRVWLEDYHENLDRNRFGAPLGAIHESGESRCLVSIRNIQWENSDVLLGAGCGIIPASELDREWQEIQAKINSVKKMFGIEV